MQKKLLGDKRNLPDEHLEEYLKSTYAQRLNWLEEANKFVAKVFKSKQNKRKETTEKHPDRNRDSALLRR